MRFRRLRPNGALYQGAVIRTGRTGTVDLFLRRLGIAVRLQPDSTMVLEQLSRSPLGMFAGTKTVLGIRAGRVYIVNNPSIEAGILEIRNAIGGAVVEGGVGRYIVSADGTQYSVGNALIGPGTPGATGITSIIPGRTFPPITDDLRPFEYSQAVQSMIEMDRVEDLGRQYERERAARDKKGRQ